MTGPTVMSAVDWTQDFLKFVCVIFGHLQVVVVAKLVLDVDCNGDPRNKYGLEPTDDIGPAYDIVCVEKQPRTLCNGYRRANASETVQRPYMHPIVTISSLLNRTSR